jgi:GMP synthase-like glutamine amidotransferase
MGSDARVLVVQHQESCGVERLGEWLGEALVEVQVLRMHEGAALPSSLKGVGGLVVMGGDADAFPAPDGSPSLPYLPRLSALLQEAVEQRVPTLGVCLGGQLLAQALGGRVGRAAAGPELGAQLVAKRDIAADDPLFAAVPFLPDVYQWHRDEILALPDGAVHLAASPRVTFQAFRVGDRAWGLQFHIECGEEMLRGWAATDRDWLRELGLDPESVLADALDRLDDVAEVWRPFAHRFAALVTGAQAGLPLPVVSG